MAEGAPLLREYTLKAYRGFESLSLRHCNMSNKTLFEKIIEREIPSEIIYEDDKTIVIKDINPQAPIHILVIPKNPYINFYDFTKNASDKEHESFWKLVNDVIESSKIETKGFRIITNSGKDGNQDVPHFHIHLLGGENLGRMIG